MEYGHIVISRLKKGWFSSLVRFVTRSDYSHTLLTVPPVCGEEMGLESSHVMTAAMPFEPWYRKNTNAAYRVYRFRASPAKKRAALVKAMRSFTAGYGYRKLPWFIWRALNKLIGRDIRAQSNWSQSGLICSDLVAQYISDAGFSHLFAKFGKASIHSQDIYEICEACPEIFELIEFKE